jgi:hypothetical protein
MLDSYRFKCPKDNWYMFCDGFICDLISKEWREYSDYLQRIENEKLYSTPDHIPLYSGHLVCNQWLA